MKAFIPLLICTLVMGCSSSSDSTNDANNELDNNEDQLVSSELAGTWVSNCHEFLGTEDEAGNNLYNISELTITESEYVDNFTSYTDMNCTENPVEESSRSNYVAGDLVATTDGVEATRISLTPLLPDQTESDITIEAIYRISGVELNFGQYIESEVPSIDLRVTYIKQ